MRKRSVSAVKDALARANVIQNNPWIPTQRLFKKNYWDCWSLMCDHVRGREHIITLLKVKAHTTLEYPQDPSLTAGNAAADKEARMCAKSAQTRKIAVHQPFISQAVSLQVHIIASLATRTLTSHTMLRVPPGLVQDDCFLFKPCCSFERKVCFVQGAVDNLSPFFLLALLSHLFCEIVSMVLFLVVHLTGFGCITVVLNTQFPLQSCNQLFLHHCLSRASDLARRSMERLLWSFFGILRFSFVKMVIMVVFCGSCYFLNLPLLFLPLMSGRIFLRSTPA